MIYDKPLAVASLDLIKLGLGLVMITLILSGRILEQHQLKMK